MFVTLTSTVPTPAGETAVMLAPPVATACDFAGVIPKSTLLSGEKMTPGGGVIVICVPPAAGPPVGLIDATTGASAGNFGAPRRVK